MGTTFSGVAWEIASKVCFDFLSRLLSNIILQGNLDGKSTNAPINSL